MMSRDAGKGKSKEDANNGKLLYQIKNISNSLSLDRNPSTSSSSSFARNGSMSSDKVDVPGMKSKQKKWFLNWGALMPISHVKHQRFTCCFTLEVHTIENLPSKFNDLSLCVHWERKHHVVVTNHIKVNYGVAEFGEILTQKCSVSGSNNGPHHSVKYKAEHFELYAVVHGNPKLDMGKHHVDLTRILPLTLEELEDLNSSGTGTTTSLKLSGEAKGAIMNVTFGYVVLRDDIAPYNKAVLQLLDPKVTARSSRASRFMDDINSLHEVSPTRTNDFSDSVNTLYQKLDEELVGSPIDIKHEIVVPATDSDLVKYSDGSPSGQSEGIFSNECENSEFSFAEERLKEKAELDLAHGIEGHIVNEREDAGFSFAEKVELDDNGANIVDVWVENSLEPSAVYDDVGNTFSAEGSIIRNDVTDDDNTEVKDISTKEAILGDLKSALGNAVEFEKEGMDTSETRSESSDLDNQNKDKLAKMMPSHSMNDPADYELRTVPKVKEPSTSFNSDLEPESPRERLLRDFLKEAEACGSSLIASGSSRFSSSQLGSSRRFNFDDDDTSDNVCYVASTSGCEEIPENSDSLTVDPSVYPKISAKVIEDLETRELMEESGFDEKTFQYSTPSSIGGLGSLIDISLPPLGEGLGPIIQTKTGGFLRSMNPVLFRNAESGVNLIMQVSSPVVVPAELGSGVMDVLQKLASMGLEKLSLQAKKRMPLEDITGKSLKQMGLEAVPRSEASKRQNLLQNERAGDQTTFADDLDSEYVSIDDLTLLATDKIEELLIEGLKIQSGMSDEEAPSNFTAQSIGKYSVLERKLPPSTGSMGFEEVAGLQLLNLNDMAIDDKDDGLMDLSVTLDQWIKLDSGEIDDDQPRERISKLLAAHHCKSTDLNFLRGKHGKSPERCGFLGNNFNVAFMVQLRDPWRDYELVGTPMLALIQVERTFVHPKPRIYCTISEARDGNNEDDDLRSLPKEKRTQEFKINKVNVAGLKGEPGKKKLWGNATQLQSGSRWLLANGMGKSRDKNPFVRPKIVSKYPLPAMVTSQPGDTLWSISTRCSGSGASYTELAAVNPHIRNPDVVLFNETIRLR